jgi:8-oxo-dGTP pyrophosphatase MutT (NUDIX family)
MLVIIRKYKSSGKGSPYLSDAALVAVLDGDEIVICKHYRYRDHVCARDGFPILWGRRGWELPGGKRDPGEDSMEAARREVCIFIEKIACDIDCD